MEFQLKRVLISDEIDQKCVEILKSNGIEVVKNTKLSKDQLLNEIKNFDGLVVRSATKVTEEVIEAGDRLKVIGRAGTGVDNINCEAASRRGILVMNTPAGNTISAAEHTCTLICSLSRHVAQARASMTEGRWDRKLYMGNELMDKTLAIIGLGRIGREVAHRMQSFGMRTIGFDPIIPAEEAATFGVEWLKLDDLWPQADYITVHTPLIPQTKNLIGVDALSKCKPTVRIVNVARGGIVDEEALLKALKAGRCGGAGLDVFVEEPPTNLDLIRHPLVLATPHLGASTQEAQSRVAVEIAEQFVDLSLSRGLNGAVNGHALAAGLSPTSRPLLRLVSSLTRVAAALSATEKSLEVIIRPACSRQVIVAVEAAAAAVLVARDGDEKANLISSPSEAKRRGLVVKGRSEDGEDGVEVKMGKWTVCGTGDLLIQLEESGGRLRHPVTMKDGTTVTVVEADVVQVVEAAVQQARRLLCVTTDEAGRTSVVVADAGLAMDGAVSVAL